MSLATLLLKCGAIKSRVGAICCNFRGKFGYWESRIQNAAGWCTNHRLPRHLAGHRWWGPARARHFLNGKATMLSLGFHVLLVGHLRCPSRRRHGRWPMRAPAPFICRIRRPTHSWRLCIRPLRPISLPALIVPSPVFIPPGPGAAGSIIGVCLLPL